MSDRRSTLPNLPRTSPSVTRRVVPRQVPEIRSTHSGLEQLGAAFSDFFRQTRGALQTMQEAAHVKEMAEIERENKAQREAGAADALAGRSPQEELSDDLDYTEAFENVSADRLGIELGRDLAAYIRTLPPEADAEAAVESWISENFGAGTDSPRANSIALARLYEKADELIATHQAGTVTHQFEVGRQQLTAAVAEDVREGIMTPELLRQRVEEARALDPMNAYQAPLMVASAVMLAVDGAPETAHSIMSLLETPGTGVNGKSFMESFPDIAGEVERQLMQASDHARTFEAHQAYQAFEHGLPGLRQQAMETGDVQGLLDAHLALEGMLNQYGGFDQYIKLRNQLAATIDDFVGDVAARNSYLQMTPETRDNSVINAYQPRIMAERGLSVFTDDAANRQQAAVLVARDGMLAPDAKAALGHALTDAADPVRRRQAYQFFGTLALVHGGDTRRALSYLPDGNARTDAMFIHRRVMAGANPDTAIAMLAEMPSQDDTAQELGLARITGMDTSDEGRAAIEELIEDHIYDAVARPGDRRWLFGGGISSNDTVVDPSIYNNLTTIIAEDTVRHGTYGDNWEETAMATLEAHADRFDVLPQPDGSNRIVFRAVDPMFPALGFDVLNPATTVAEDTTQRAREALESLPNNLPALQDREYRLAPLSPLEENLGYRVIESNGNHLVIDIGDEITIQTADGEFETVLLPEDTHAAAAILGDALPADYVLSPYPSAEAPEYYQVYYRPRFEGFTQRTEDHAPPTAEDLGLSPDQGARMRALRRNQPAGDVPVASGQRTRGAMSDLAPPTYRLEPRTPDIDLGELPEGAAARRQAIRRAQGRE